MPAFGESHQADVGEQFQPQLDPVGLPRRAFLGEPRRLPRGGREALVPVPAAPSIGNHRPLARHHKVESAPIHRRRLGSGRHRNLPVLSPRPMLVRPFAVPTPLCSEMPAPFQRPKVPSRGIANKHHIPPMPAVPTIGTTPRHMRLPPKGDTAVAPGPALNPNLRLVVHRSSEGNSDFVSYRATNPPSELGAGPERGPRALPQRLPDQRHEPKQATSCATASEGGPSALSTC